MSPKLKFFLFSGLLFLALLVTYSNHWQNDFHFDDAHTILNNVYIQKLSNIPLFFKDVSTFSSLPRNASYRPIVSTTLAIDYWAGNGLHPFYFHVSTFILFILQGVLMFFFFLKLLNEVSTETPNKFISLFTVALYLLHPVQAETINYIIARSDSISTLFVLLGFVTYQYSASSRKYFLYLVPVLIGCLAKPTAIMFAPMLVVYHVLFEQKASLWDITRFNWKKLLLIAVPSFLLGLCIYLFIKQKETSWISGGSSFYNYFITQPFIFIHYISQFILPTQLSADTDWVPFTSITHIKSIIGFAFLAGLIYCIFFLSRFQHWRPVSFGLAFFVLALFPTTVVPLAEVMNDHRMFYPFVGLSVAIVWALYLLLQNYLLSISKSVLTGILLLILCGYAYGTYERNKVWRSEETLWKDVSIKSPHNGRGLMNYGLVFMGRASYDTASYYFTKALDYCPRYSLLHINLAVLKNAIGDKRMAQEYFKSGIALGNEAGNYYFYARFLKDNGQKDEAIQNLYKCIQLVDARMDARYMLIPLLYEQKRFEELKTVCQRTLEISPGDATAATYLKMAGTGKSQLEVEEENSAQYSTAEQFLNLSLLYYNAGNFEKCIEAAKKAIALKPDYAEAYNNICSAYNALDKFAEGAKACEQALKIKPGYALAEGNLNWAKKNLLK